MKKLVSLFAIFISVASLGNIKENLILKNGSNLVVTEVGEGSLRNVNIKLIENSKTRVMKLKEVDPIKEFKVADLNKDGVEEIYIATTSASSGSYGTLYAYSSKTLKEIKIPEMKESKGYMGHDKFIFTDNKILREYPRYNDGDSNNHPTGGDARVEYQLDSNNSFIIK